MEPAHSRDGGLPDPGGLNLDYAAQTAFEPGDDQLEVIKQDLETVAAGVRPHLLHGFTVTTRVTQTPTGPQGIVMVSFPTGDTIGPAIQLTPDMFTDTEESGALSPEEITELSREITTVTVAQWAEMRGLTTNAPALPAK